MGNVSLQFIQSLLIVILGYVCKKLNVISEHDSESLVKVIFNITLPALVINIISKSNIDGSLIFLPLINIAYGIVMVLAASVTFRKAAKAEKGMFSMMLPGLNVALFAYPLTEAIWGQKALIYFAMFDMGSSVVIFGLCYFMAGYYSPNEEEAGFLIAVRRITRSVPLIVLVITFILRLSGLHLPGIIIDVTAILARANMPLCLLLLGVYLSFTFDGRYWKNVAGILLIRYLTGIFIGTVLFLVLPFDSIFRATILIGFLLPIATSVIPYSVQFGYDRKFVGTVTNLTIILSFFLIWAVSILLNTVI